MKQNLNRSDLFIRWCAAMRRTFAQAPLVFLASQGGKPIALAGWFGVPSEPFVNDNQRSA